MRSFRLLRMLKRSLGFNQPLMELIAIVQPVSVQNREMWQMGRDTTMYPQS